MSPPNYLVEMLISTAPRGPHIYPMPPRTWRRASRIMNRYGAVVALELLDARAERAFKRGDIPGAVRWRDLMAAIHATINDNPMEGDSYQ
jgi:hypothetical protein